MASPWLMAPAILVVAAVIALGGPAVAPVVRSAIHGSFPPRLTCGRDCSSGPDRTRGERLQLMAAMGWRGG